MRNKMFIHAMIEILIPGIVGVGLLIFIPSQIDISSSFYQSSSSPLLFPKLIAWFMILISVFRVIHFLMKRQIDGDGFTGLKLNKKLLLGTVILFAYVVFIPVIGFLAATFLNIIGLIYVLDRVQWYKAVSFSLVSTFVIWYAFSHLLGIPLPVGVIGI